MSRAAVRNQLFLNDGLGNKVDIATGTFVTSAVNIDEHRRLSFTIGMSGGFTGTMTIQGTDEIAQCYGQTGTPEAGYHSRPGTHPTGALFWQTIPSGVISITNATTQMLLSFTDVGVAFVRVSFNQGGPTGAWATGYQATGTLGGSGTIKLFMTGKNT